MSCVCKLSYLLIPAFWSSAGIGLTSWLLFVMLNCFLSLSHVISWVRRYLIVQIPDLCHLSYFSPYAISTTILCTGLDKLLSIFTFSGLQCLIFLFQVASVNQRNKDTIVTVYQTMLEDIVALKSIHVEIVYAIMEVTVW